MDIAWCSLDPSIGGESGADTAAPGREEDDMANTRNPIDRARLRQGMRVYSGEGQKLGPIERLDADSITVKGQQYEFDSLERLEGDRVFLARQVGASADRARGAAGATAAGTAGAARGPVVEADEAQVRVPVREERLEVEKRPTELGAVEVRKTVEAEQKTVPVELEREEVRVRKEETERPAREGELAGAFEEGTIRVPVRGEEAVARKEAVVTGEVVIDKQRTTDTKRVTDTVRKERVEVDDDYERNRAAYQQAYAGRQPAPTTSYEEAEPHFREGYGAGLEARRAGRSWEQSEADLRTRYRAAGAGDDAWERIKREVREGFDRARGR
jgi:uncharacterized protein (TIGR02271 family)